MSVEFKFTSSDESVVKALENMTRKMQALKDETRKLKEESKASAAAAKETSDGGSQALTGMIKNVGAAAASYFTLGAAISVVTSEIKNLEGAQNKAAETQKTTADAQIKFLRNLGVVNAAEKQKILAGLQEISKTRGQTESQLYQSASSAASARGSLSNEAMLSAVDVAARLVPEGGQEQGTTAGGLMDLAKVTGSSNALVNAGFMNAVGKQARIESLEQINKALTPAMINVAKYGGKPGDAGALVSTLTAASGDQEGRISGTAALQLTQQLEEFMPEEDKFHWDAKGKKTRIAKGTGISDPMERIRRMQADPKLRERFMGTAGVSFEEKQRKTIEAMLTGGSMEAKLLEQNAAEFPVGADAEKAGLAFIEFINEGKLQKAAGQERRMGASADRMELDDLGGGDAGRIRQGVDKLLAASGATMSRRRVAHISSLLSGTGLASATPEDVGIGALGGRVAKLTDDEKKPLPGREDVVAELREMIALLKDIRDKKAGPKNINLHGGGGDN